MEVAALVWFAQLADFSSVSRLDQYVAAIQPQTVTKVVNVLNVQMMREKSWGHWRLCRRSACTVAYRGWTWTARTW